MAILTKDELAEAIIQSFKAFKCESFTIDEALLVVQSLNLQHLLTGTAPVSVTGSRIVLGSLLGRNGMNLTITKDSSGVRRYWIP